MSSISALNEHAHRVRDFIHADLAFMATPSNRHLEQLFNSLALELFELQYRANAPYRRLCDRRGVKPGAMDTWEQIPAVPTAAFKELEFSCLPPGQRTAVFFSSGTTGQARSRHFHNADSLGLYDASLLGWFNRHVQLPAQDAHAPVALVLTPPAKTAPNSSLAHMFSTICGALPPRDPVFAGEQTTDGSWNLNLEKATNTLRKASVEQRPVLAMGTAFLFVHLLDHLRAAGIHLQLPPGSVIIETGGYKGRSRILPKAELHQEIADTLGVHPGRILCEYGMSELSSQAYDLHIGPATDPAVTPLRRHFQFPPWTRIQVISPETGQVASEGETGLLRIFDLANAYSVLAIQTEDLAVRHRSGFELLGRAPTAEARGCSLMSLQS